MLELVYLWVEDYKNIHKQGFNFSPRFDCKFHDEYAENGNLKDNCKLVICDKKKKECKDNDYIENFFGDNINVTAIVGKNGSGKSSIFELLASINFEIDKLKRSYFYIVEDDDNLKVYSKDIDNINTNKTIEKYFSLNYKLQSGNKSDRNNNVNFSKYFGLCYLNISHLEQDGIIENDVPLQKINYLGIYAKNKFETDEKSIHPLFGVFYLDRFNYFQTYAISQLLIDKKYKDLLFDIFNINEPFCINLSYSLEELKKPHLDISKDLIEFLESVDNDIIELNSSRLKDFFDKCKGDYNIENYIKLTFQTKQYEDIKFSTGEKTILFYLQRIDFMLSEMKDKSTILLFDEIELYLHPNWQKRILKIIIDFIKDNNLDKLLTIIITSHSPFLLSDIPKQNIIFLDKDENGNCKVVDGLKEKKQTFGANIHTLLSDSFFMEDGLMGEFAKSKINEIINFHKEVEEENNKKISNFTLLKAKYEIDKTKFWQIQSIIGEEYLKQVVKNHLRDIERILLGHDEAKKEEILRLRKEADRLEKM